jgi:murein DD-endopeptidase MepM/ murein hydrolase activator NlpD
LAAAFVFVLSATASYGLLNGLGTAASPAVEAQPEVAVHVIPELAAPAVAASATPEPLFPEVRRVAPPDLAAVLPVAAPIEAVAIPVEAEAAPVRVPEATPGHLRLVTGRIPTGGTVGGALREQGISDPVVLEITQALRPAFDFRQARAGDFYAVIMDESGEFLSFEFRRGRTDVYRLDRKPGGELEPQADEAPLERRVVQLGGVVRTSLFEALGELGEGAEIASRFAEVFAWDFDFSRQTRPGDEFRMVFEKFYDRDGFVRYGKVLAGRYASSKGRELTALYFEDEAGHGDYYTPDGNSVRRSFLRAPLTYTRISSGYSKARLHPILKVRRPHEGIDYAAPRGTPVWAVANGTVSFAGWKGGYGRLVQVRHDNGYVSFYGHLSRFANGVRAGRRVQQQDVIGYVGSTGLATGPHLDYRLQYKGRFVDPLKVKFAQGRPIPPSARPAFERVVESRMAELNEATPAFVLEAAM